MTAASAELPQVVTVASAVSKPPASDRPVPRPSLEALSIFFRSLAVMIQAGVSLNRSFELLGKQSEDQRMGAVAQQVARRLDAGVGLAQAMAMETEAFSPIQVRMIQIGERTGTLDDILANLADYEEKRRTTTMKVRSALTYPLFLLVLSTVMLVIVPPYMFGGLFALIENSATEPPLITKLVLAVSHFIRSTFFWVLALLGGCAAAALGPRLLRQPAVRTALARQLLAIPVLGRTYRVLGTARFARALQIQLEVGETPLAGLRMGAEASGNPVLEENIQASVEALKAGDPIVESLRRADFFPAAFLHVLSAGEETAQLPAMMGKMAEIYEAELEAALDAFTSLLEPLVMLVMGGIVGVVVIATMLPMMQLLQNL